MLQQWLSSSSSKELARGLAFHFDQLTSVYLRYQYFAAGVGNKDGLVRGRHRISIERRAAAKVIRTIARFTETLGNSLLSSGILNWKQSKIAFLVCFKEWVNKRESPAFKISTGGVSVDTAETKERPSSQSRSDGVLSFNRIFLEIKVAATNLLFFNAHLDTKFHLLNLEIETEKSRGFGKDNLFFWVSSESALKLAGEKVGHKMPTFSILFPSFFLQLRDRQGRLH